MQRNSQNQPLRAAPAGKHHTRHAKFNRKGTPRWVPVSNATLDKDTLTKAPDNARLTISKSMVLCAGMAVGPPKGLKMSVTYVMQRKCPIRSTYAHSSKVCDLRNAIYNRKGTPRWVPVSNATLDKDTLTKAPDNARMTISKSTVTFAGMDVWPLKGLKNSVTYVIQRKCPN